MNENKKGGDSLEKKVQSTLKLLNQHKQSIDLLMLRTNQQQQISDQYRRSIYNIELKIQLLIKMLEEKEILVKDEFNKRWPLFLKNDIGVVGPNGLMEGKLKVTFYGDN